MGPSNNSSTSHSRSYNLFKAVGGKSDPTPEKDADSATFGKRSTAGSRVDFTASPSKKIKIRKGSSSSTASASSNGSGASGASGMMNDSFEFEKYLSDFKARDAREAMLGNRV